MRLTFFAFIIFFNVAHAQNETNPYKAIYAAADSISSSGIYGHLDSSIYKMAGAMNHAHPAEIIVKSSELMTGSTFNEASFLFYVGYMRYRYYNRSNPNYKASEDGALLASLNYTVGEAVRMYLKACIDNFISILHSSINYYQNNDYAFYSRDNNAANYDSVAISFTVLHDDLITNKSTYQTQWNEERKSLENFMDSAQYYSSSTIIYDDKKKKRQKK